MIPDELIYRIVLSQSEESDRGKYRKPRCSEIGEKPLLLIIRNNFADGKKDYTYVSRFTIAKCSKDRHN